MSKDSPHIEYPDHWLGWYEVADVAYVDFKTAQNDNPPLIERLKTVVLFSDYMKPAYANKIQGNIVGIYSHFTDAFAKLQDLVPQNCLSIEKTYCTEMSWKVEDPIDSAEHGDDVFVLYLAGFALPSNELLRAFVICRNEDPDPVEAHFDIELAVKRLHEMGKFGYTSVSEAATEIGEKLFPPEIDLPDVIDEFGKERFPWLSDHRHSIEYPLNHPWEFFEDKELPTMLAKQNDSGLSSMREELSIIVLTSPYLYRDFAYGVYKKDNLQKVFSDFHGAVGYMLELAKQIGLKNPAMLNNDLRWIEREELASEWVTTRRWFTPNCIPTVENYQIILLHNPVYDIIACGLCKNGAWLDIYLSAEEAAKDMRREIRNDALRYWAVDAMHD